jgi:hypothetical protein
LTSGLTFAIATRDELRLRGRVVEQRLSHGVARHDGSRIDAADARDDELVVRCDTEIENLRAVAPDDARVRLMATARRVEDVTIAASTMTIGMNGLFVVTDAAHASSDAAWLRTLAIGTATADYRSLPIVWHRGSASVLLHEAAGHAAEHEHARVAWPSWLTVRDEPTHLDDLGRDPRATDLLSGEPPASFRRESFRDVPLRRMSRLIARGSQWFDLPEPRIDILLLGGGAYEPLDETVTIHVAAAKLGEQWLAPFTIRESRESVARAIAGAIGEPLRYPGVVCSWEGQELVVASRAPVMLTRFR